MEKVHHLSHTDLDGYACQFLTNHCFENIEFYNSNYGNEIDEKLNNILRKIENEDFDKFLILITDLNLTSQQATFLQEAVKKSEKEIEILLLDHHITGKDCAQMYSWYNMDISKSATKITYDFFMDKYKIIKQYDDFVNIVNAVDIWLKDHEKFEAGKVCMRLVRDAKEINRTLFPKENNRYIFFLLQRAQSFFDHSKGYIKLDDSLHRLKKEFFSNSNDMDKDTLDNLVSHFIVSLLSSNKEEMSINYEGYKGILTYSIGNVSVIGNEFLIKNEDFDFFMDITGRKTISLRANGNMDVSSMAKKIAGGGGHRNASGGRLNNFKDSFLYDNIKTQVQKILNAQ